MSHGDYMEKVPQGFALVAHSDACPNVAIADESRGFYGVQYHPEVNHTEYGRQMLRNFLYEVCDATGDWSMGDYKATAIRDIREKVGDGRVLLALSGGVDSSVAAALLAEAVGSQLTCVFVDHGLMRLNEGDEVEQAFSRWDLNFVRVDAEADVYKRQGAALATKLIHSGEADVMMKGILPTATFVRAILSHENGLVPPGGLISQAAVFPHEMCIRDRTSGRSSNPCGCSSRTRSVSWAGSWACPSISSAASPSRVRALPSGSSAR